MMIFITARDFPSEEGRTVSVPGNSMGNSVVKDHEQPTNKHLPHWKVVNRVRSRAAVVGYGCLWIGVSGGRLS